MKKDNGYTNIQLFFDIRSLDNETPISICVLRLLLAISTNKYYRIIKITKRKLKSKRKEKEDAITPSRKIIG